MRVIPTFTNKPGLRPACCCNRHLMAFRNNNSTISTHCTIRKIHAHLIGVDPDFRVDVSEPLLDVIGASLSEIC
jgi:hypothetical protein